MSTVPIPSATAANGAFSAAADASRARLHEAAQQFEAILLRQMLATSRQTDFGGSDLFGQSDDTFREMRDTRFADIAASSGQLGFAGAIERQLSRHLPGRSD